MHRRSWQAQRFQIFSDEAVAGRITGDCKRHRCASLAVTTEIQANAKADEPFDQISIWLPAYMR
jgi:hypothetical protein